MYTAYYAYLTELDDIRKYVDCLEDVVRFQIEIFCHGTRVSQAHHLRTIIVVAYAKYRVKWKSFLNMYVLIYVWLLCLSQKKIFQMTLVGTPNVIETADSSYADYADNFDLSLLSMDNDFNSIVNGMSSFFSPDFSVNISVRMTRLILNMTNCCEKNN